MLNSLKSLHIVVKIVIVLALIALSVVLIPESSIYANSIGYISLFAGLFVINEGFGMSLFPKIMIALTLGILLTVFPVFPAQALAVIKPVGSEIFMNCLTMALVPLVFASILTGVTSLGDVTKLSAIGSRTIAYYVITTAVAITIGLVIANTWNPGSELDDSIKTRFITENEIEAKSKVDKAQQDKQTLFEGLVSIFPKNIMQTVSDERPNMLQLIFFAMISGIALLSIKEEYATPVIRFFTGITEMTIRIVVMVMRIAPYGVFALIAAQISATSSTELIAALVPFSISVILALVIHGFVLNYVSVKYLSKYNPIDFFKKIKEVAVFAFSTSSSGATIPVSLETAEKKLNVRNEVGGFVIPLGATINMDGTALFQGVSAIFLANIYGVDLTLGSQLMIVALVVAASIGTAAVPGVGIVMLTLVLVEVGIPPEGILFILPVNNLLDMFRTVVNVTGDLACTMYINRMDQKLHEQPISTT